MAEEMRKLNKTVPMAEVNPAHVNDSEEIGDKFDGPDTLKAFVTTMYSHNKVSPLDYEFRPLHLLSCICCFFAEAMR